ncbi:hypothetical protein LCGC14_2609530 [marine sediment metagenome]|uniref:Uncharacterized protein n=1 Tax=marine sediment metagenome TaxID=412755 RepID=A0A0F9CHB9_9ZZZZ
MSRAEVLLNLEAIYLNKFQDLTPTEQEALGEAIKHYRLPIKQ